MKIQDSTVQLSASHEASRTRIVEVAAEQGFRRIFDTLASAPQDDVQGARQRVQKLLQSLIDAILAAIDGKKCEADFAVADAAPVFPEQVTGSPEITWRREVTEKISESENTLVCGKGCVKTCDGKQINFDFSLNLERSYSSETREVESGTIALRDPLVLSFDGKACELLADRITFDLDADGKPEQIPALGKASGFLVLDRNGNGRADDGSELFGVASGNGFSDLALLDNDRNGWIDEGDTAYEQLAIWSGEAFSSLKERGVGALYTGAVDAPFSLKTSSNELLGQIRAAGIYLTETGQFGHLQELDLRVSALPDGQKQPDEGKQLSA